MTEHTPTPTPWIIRSQVQQGKNKGGFYLAPDETCSASAWASNQANAAFIVKACNHHEALVEAAENLIDEISTSGTHQCWKRLANLISSIKESV